jgi:hypothetical protein
MLTALNPDTHAMDASTEPKPPEGAILSDDQIRKLRIAVIIMSIALVAGVATLIGRVIYLANRGSEQGTPRATVSSSGAIAQDVRATLPTGAALKSTSLTGDRILAHYTGPKGEGLLVLDLVTGKTLSHVRFETAP